MNHTLTCRALVSPRSRRVSVCGSMLSQRLHYVVHMVLLTLLVFATQYRMPHHMEHAAQVPGQNSGAALRCIPQSEQVVQQAVTASPTAAKDLDVSQSSSSPSSSCRSCPEPACVPCPDVKCARNLLNSTEVPAQLGTLISNDDVNTLMWMFNEAQPRNAAKYKLESGFVPLVLRVHREELFLFQTTLRLYSGVLDIHKTLLVISFDALFPELINEAMKIDYCQVKILLAPSGHWMKNRVPGPEPGLPDVRDHYNNPRSWMHSAIKHHFWWQTATVWERVAELKDVQGDMCFAEADHWPLPDYYQVAKAMQELRKSICTKADYCFGSNLGGTPERELPHFPVSSDAFTKYSFGYRGNMGMCYPRSTWERLKKVAFEFCHHDDYNWDETLLQIAKQRKLPPASVIPDAPRLVHITHCGFHTQKDVCKDTDIPKRQLEQFEATLWSKWPKFDPDAKWTHRNAADTGELFNGWGGWSHPADINFCMQQVVPKNGNA